MSNSRALADVHELLRLAEHSPAWAILRAQHAPVILTVLGSVFPVENNPWPGTELMLQVDPLLTQIREETGLALPRTATAYVNDWVKSGYLVRRSPHGSREEFYELSPDTLSALDYLRQLSGPQRSVTRSRLSTLTDRLADLAAETDPDDATVLQRLEEEKARVEARIARVQAHGALAITDTEAQERAREVLALAADLPADFARVREEIEKLDRTLRESILSEKVSAGEVLDNIFRGVDLIAESEAGRAFSGFYDLLFDREQATRLDATVAAILSRDFIAQLEIEERTALRGLVRALENSADQVHEATTALSRSLRRFVQSREVQSQQALASAISRAQQLALRAGALGRDPSRSLGIELELTTRQPRSLSTWVLHDPATYRITEGMTVHEPEEIDLAAMRARIRESEIDWAELQESINYALTRQELPSIREVLSYRPATQGLASVVGLIKLAHRHGYRSEGSEYLPWTSAVGRRLQARYDCHRFRDPVPRPESGFGPASGPTLRGNHE